MKDKDTKPTTNDARLCPSRKPRPTASTPSTLPKSDLAASAEIIPIAAGTIL